VKKVFVSAGGVREGLLFRDLTETQRQEDPLLAGVTHLASRLSPEPAFGAALVEFTNGLFGDEAKERCRIRVAACLLADIGAYFHPDFRGIQAFESILRAPLVGVTHPERIAIALALYVRHAGYRTLPAHEALSLLTSEEISWAINLGSAMRFAAALSPKAPGALRRCKLKIEAGNLVFVADKYVQEMMTEYPRKRLEALASTLSLPLSETYSD
jgi:exopolyphosphatase/guanosine-5'-triphosphate,3'-diphosphate pyrophosphatase